MIKSKPFLLVVFLVLLFLFLGTILIPNKPKEYSNFVTQSPSPTGTKALYSVLSEETKKVDVWKGPVRKLINNNQLMVMVQPDQTFDRLEINQWESWVKKGNRLWIIVDDPEGFFDLKSDEETFNSNQKVSLIKGFGKTFKGTVFSPFRLKPKKSDHILLKDKKGVLSLSRPMGDGELLVLLNPEWLTNGQINHDDHLSIILSIMNQMNPDHIWFNERIHGSRNLPVMFTVYPKWYSILFAQCILIVILWLWMKGKRFGSITIPRESVVRFGDERLHAASAWYRRGGFYFEAIEAQKAYFREILFEKWGVSRTAKSEEVIQICKKRLGDQKAREWNNGLSELDHLLAGQKLTNKAFLEYSRRIDDMRKEVDNA